MAAKGAEAKKLVIDKIKEAFGSDFIGEYDKKVYVWSKENGGKVQIAISLTCPKNPVGVTNLDNKLDFTGSNKNTVVAPEKFEPAEITQEEKDNIASLMEQFGL